GDPREMLQCPGESGATVILESAHQIAIEVVDFLRNEEPAREREVPGFEVWDLRDLQMAPSPIENRAALFPDGGFFIRINDPLASGVRFVEGEMEDRFRGIGLG